MLREALNRILLGLGDGTFRVEFHLDVALGS